MLQLRSGQTLDHGDRGWLKARHHFIVSADGNPANGPLGALVVWNDDEIAPGAGFGRHTFQIWLRPRQRGGAPRWDTRKFPKADRAGRLIELASGDSKNPDALTIRADARILGATLFAGTTLTHVPPAHLRHTYLAPAQGAILVNGQRVAVGDGLAALDEPELTITAIEDAEFILVDAA
jgi:quercetin 2,3-dioxygenase